MDPAAIALQWAIKGVGAISLMQPDKKLSNNELRTLEKAPEGNKSPSAVLNSQ